MSEPEADGRERLRQWAEEQTCPSCGHQGLVVDWRLEARPLGSFSLSGNQLKVSAREHPWLRCPSCGVEGKGHH